MVDIERHPVEITPAARELLRAHGRMIAEIAGQFARDREAEGSGDVVGYFGVGARRELERLEHLFRARSVDPHLGVEPGGRRGE